MDKVGVVYFLAYVILIACVGTILNPCNELIASVECDSLSYSTNAISVRPGTRRTSCSPGNL